MELLFKHIVVGLVPQPRQIPPSPYPKEDLQRLFVEVSRDYPYQQFTLLPGDSGAQISAGLEDVLVVQPGLLQLRSPVELTTETARQKCMTVLRASVARLGFDAFLQCGIKVVAHVALTGANVSAKAFVSERLMRSGDQASDLGPNFFGGGVKYRRINENGEETLLVEPFIHDDAYVFIDYDVGRASTQGPMTDVEEIDNWLSDAFSFVGTQTMALLKT